MTNKYHDYPEITPERAWNHFCKMQFLHDESIVKIIINPRTYTIQFVYEDGYAGNFESDAFVRSMGWQEMPERRRGDNNNIK